MNSLNSELTAFVHRNEPHFTHRAEESVKNTHFSYSDLFLSELLQRLDEQIGGVLNLDRQTRSSRYRGALLNAQTHTHAVGRSLSHSPFGQCLFHKRSQHMLLFHTAAIYQMTSTFKIRSVSRKPSLTGTATPNAMT